MKLFIDTIVFSSDQHRFQRRKDAGKSAYIHHPLRVVQLLVSVGIDKIPILQAGVLHDVIEDTNCTVAKIEGQFGNTVKNIVLHVSDDKSLSKEERKEQQILKVAAIDFPPEAMLIKLADKISNLEDIYEHPPLWNDERKKQYVIWSSRVVQAIKNNFMLRKNQPEMQKFVPAIFALLEKYEDVSLAPVSDLLKT